jgi:hypothetical protein
MSFEQSLAEQKLALMQILHQVESERVLQLVKAYLDDLVAFEASEEQWDAQDQAAIEKGISDLDAGKGIPWEDFRARFARYEA